MSRREEQRLAWRAKVTVAAKEWQTISHCSRGGGCRCIFRIIKSLRSCLVGPYADLGPPDTEPAVQILHRLDAALRAPKPWLTRSQHQL